MRKLSVLLILVLMLSMVAGVSAAPQAPAIQPASPSLPLGPVAPASNPEAVLWDQPLSTVNQNAYVDQDFTDVPDYSSYLADDFVNAAPWTINLIFVPGNGWNGFTTLANATALNWQIYADNAGIPAGDPSSGGAIWSLSLPPTSPQVAIANGSGGMPSNTTLTLAAPITVPAGHWWLVFYPSMPFSGGGQYGRQPADTLNLNWTQFINPGGGFGYGTAWQSWAIIGATNQDLAFRLEGTLPVECSVHLFKTKLNWAYAARPGWVKTVFSGIVHDQLHAVVGGATVTGFWTINGAAQPPVSFVTTAAGQFKFPWKGPWAPPGVYSFQVTNIQYDACAYDPGANHLPGGAPYREVTVPPPPY